MHEYHSEMSVPDWFRIITRSHNSFDWSRRSVHVMGGLLIGQLGGDLHDQCMHDQCMVSTCTCKGGLLIITAYKYSMY